MSRHNQRAESPSLVIPGAGAIPSIFDLSSLPSDTPHGKGTGHGGDDLSLSDLSLANARGPGGNEGPKDQWDEEEEDYEPPPFMLLNETPAPKRIMPEPEEQPEELEEAGEDEGDMTMSQLGMSSRRNESVLDEGEISIRTPQRSTRNMPESPPPSVYSRSRTAAERREEQLHAALFQLRKINAVFGDYVGALEAVDANTEAKRQVERTNAILDRYVRMLDQQEQTSKLVFDEEWRGGEGDEQTIQERIEQQARLERELKEREERERREREEREREEAERALAEQEARERAAKAASTGRGRGTTRGAVTRGTASPWAGNHYWGRYNRKGGSSEAPFHCWDF
ncbi:hypothetical protein FRC11_000644 [Ceratobasidium sp. 423]|nr:hypothetical protein FRC11_000644 [Ceratobasidium sp. 423]